MANVDSFYDQFCIKKYKYLTLTLEDRQRYLGQAVAWLESPGEMQRITSLTKEERDELFDVVLPQYEAAIAKLFQPDHMNYAWLGNDFKLHKGHGHMHLVPRYAGPREFLEITFPDPRWGSHYSPYESLSQPIEIALAVRKAIADVIVE